MRRQQHRQSKPFLPPFFNLEPVKILFIIWVQHRKTKQCSLPIIFLCLWSHQHHYPHLIFLPFLPPIHQSSPSSPTRQKHVVCLLLPSFCSVFPCFAPLPVHSLPPPPCPKSSEGHPGAQRVAVMSANEPIDNLSTGWLVLQALTMCFTEHFLARAPSLLDLRPAMPSIWA